jgi:hypothetical protein
LTVGWKSNTSIPKEMRVIISGEALFFTTNKDILLGNFNFATISPLYTNSVIVNPSQQAKLTERSVDMREDITKKQHQCMVDLIARFSDRSFAVRQVRDELYDILKHVRSDFL